MIVGIGIDMVHIERILRALERTPRFPQRILTKEELLLMPPQGRRRAEWVAGRFAAKEAFAKALGTGIGSDFSWKDLSILMGEKDKPEVKLHFAKDQEGLWMKRSIHLSITHEREHALALVVIEEKES